MGAKVSGQDEAPDAVEAASAGGYTEAMPVPIEPHPALVPFAPAARRELTVHGATVELVLVPQRKERHGRATAERPAFARSPAPRITRDEVLWQADGLVLTPNRYPFAAQQRILWPAAPVREPDRAFWRAVLDWVARSGGTALVNNVGAAATIARAHAHLVPERLPFLAALPERACGADLLELPRGVELRTKDVPFCLLGLRGDVDGLASALVLLAEARLTAAWNVVVAAGAAWVCPRAVETPAPHFPYALGAAELWGRWCYMDEAPFAAATSAALEQALAVAGKPALAG